MPNNLLILDILNRDIVEKNMEIFIDIQKDFKYSNWTKQNFLLELENKWDFSIYSKLNEKIVGYIISSKKNYNVYYIHLFLVDVAYRNHNIGKRMLEKSIYIAKKHNMSNIILRVSKENIIATNFYRKNRFYTTDEITDDLSGPIPDLIMKFDI